MEPDTFCVNQCDLGSGIYVPPWSAKGKPGVFTWPEALAVRSVPLISRDSRTAGGSPMEQTGGASQPGVAQAPPGAQEPLLNQNLPDDADATPVDFNDLFSLRRPRDVRAGVASGLKSIAKGLVGGTASLVVAPAHYAQQEGWKGFGKGLAVGMAGAVVLPVTGVAVGATQMLRGVVNTPEAIYETTRGRYWDHLERQWVDEPPMHIVAQHPGDDKAAPKGTAGGSRLRSWGGVGAATICCSARVGSCLAVWHHIGC